MKLIDAEQVRGWQPMSTAPEDRPIVLFTRGGYVLLAKWQNLDDFATWVAAEEDAHPPSWDDGVCWEFNSDDEQSDPPVWWSPLPPAPEQP